MTKQKPNLLLKYYAEVTKSKQLHFGYWEEGEELNMKNLRAAQDRYLNHLINFIPDGVKTILDVGCGVGGNAIRLKKEGYEVISLSPDPYQEKVFKENTGGEIPFFLSKFEEFRTSQKFDLILMSESTQYIDIKKGFKKCHQILQDKGYLLVSDFFKVDNIDDSGIDISGHSNQRYLEEAESNGFVIIKSEDITTKIAPTLDFMVLLFNDYLIPSFKIIAYALEIYLPFFYKITGFLLRGPLKKALKKSVVDAQTFARHRRYIIYLFQLQT